MRSTTRWSAPGTSATDGVRSARRPPREFACSSRASRNAVSPSASSSWRRVLTLYNSSAMVRRPLLLSLLVLCLFVALDALAATHVWTGAADDHFSNAENWIGGSPAGDASADLSFPASSRPVATNDINGLVAQSIAFSSGGFAIGGNAITFAANAVVIDTSQAANAISCNLVLAGDV